MDPETHSDYKSVIDHRHAVSKRVIVGALLALIATVIVYIKIGSTENLPSKVVAPTPVFCSFQTKLCPDGSLVRKSGASCSYPSCNGRVILDLRSRSLWEGVSIKYPEDAKFTSVKNGEVTAYEVRDASGTVVTAFRHFNDSSVNTWNEIYQIPFTIKNMPMRINNLFVMKNYKGQLLENPGEGDAFFVLIPYSDSNLDPIVFVCDPGEANNSLCNIVISSVTFD